MLPLEPHRSEDLAVTTGALLLRAQIDDLLKPFYGVSGAELGCGEGKVVFDVEAGGSIEDCVVNPFGMVGGGDGEDAFVFGLYFKVRTNSLMNYSLPADV